ncbi:MAG TPA: transposase, partial [Isosphaeraceae bacterium]|nr:transposase [Isosphaeraceae bacterium]
MALFDKPADYEAFQRVIEEAVERTKVRLLSYCVMPTHWHLLVWPRRDGELSDVMRWLTVTHAQRWHAQRQTSGTGPIYQGRFKSFPVQSNEHFLTVARYVERNAVRAKLVARAEDWRWSSLWRRLHRSTLPEGFLSRWPVAMPQDWVRRVNRALTAGELEALRRSVRRGQPYGSDRWVRSAAQRLGLESTLRPQGRPR